MTGVEARGKVRVTRSGPVLPVSVPALPWWAAVPLMLFIVLAMSVVAVLAVVS